MNFFGLNKLFNLFFSVMLPYFGSSLSNYSIIMNNLVTYVSNHASVNELVLFSVKARISALNH
jgi:hypothetical protein